MANLSRVVVSLKAERERAEKTVAALNDLGYKLSTKSRRQARGLRTMSAAARRRIARRNALAGLEGKPPRRKAEEPPESHHLCRSMATPSRWPSLPNIRAKEYSLGSLVTLESYVGSDET